ncbi:ABC transporter transmembrane domain-containing protein [Phenylobacterium sp.]|uniref:ABC transporter transmembrane domain-containing protein n=1 Tax=Phenylobacterium sp. TaxID=1871053 RepID=UPI0027313135|nr:ABC transporter transmembrane domain-containing protein [Phenylobacterium sp.]MDP1874436.1 ABC transporter transmembrane domain-containing protein [Phenylobacterium sp.]MDP3491056.1 ABC transporter transmembrane domain-containing protein [Phenylobacterium sp.]
MSQPADIPAAAAPGPEGRPGVGAELAQNLDEAAERRPRSRNVGALRRLLPFARRRKGEALGALVFLIGATAATLGLSGAVRLLVDALTAPDISPARVNLWFALIGAVALALALSSALRYFFVTKLGERVVADLREAVYAHILTLDPGFFLRTRTGEVLSRLTTDIQIVESLMATSVSVALRNLLTLIGALILLVWVSPGLTGLVILIFPFVIAPLFVFGRRVRRLTVSTQDQFAQAVGQAGETLDALETVQAFGGETAAARSFDGAVERAFETSLRRMTARAVMTALVIALVFGGVVAIFWLGVHAGLRGEMSWGALFQFAFLAVMAAGSVGALGETWGDVQKAAGAMDRIAELLDARPGIAAPASPVTLLSPSQGAVAFEAVTFAYPGRPDLPALQNFTLKVAPGERVALVGPSGAGKSTVFRLLLRFYDPDQGVVRLDGTDLRQADPRAVRDRMALVAQDSPLFSGSAGENIAFGRPDAQLEDILAAAQAAQARGFIEALPEGFQTPLGDRARSLSGGQRQRLAIARALIRQAPILLLDEATSALDAENERLVQTALDEAMRGRTTLVIAHRLATVLKADRIVVMDQGQVVEQGTHAELSAQGGLYARLVALQFGQAA